MLPFRVLRPDTETDFLSFSLADAVASGLSGLQSLVVRSSLAASRFASDTPDLKAIASEAAVDAVLVGTLLRAGDQLRVSSQLVDASAATVLWSHTAQVPVGDLFRVQDELTGKIVESLSLPLTTRERRMMKQDVPSSPHAYELYLRANEMSRDSANWQTALDLYEACVKDDPHYAPGWAGLGRMHRMIGKYVDNETSERFAKAEVALKRALELNPDLSSAEHLYARSRWISGGLRSPWSGCCGGRANGPPIPNYSPAYRTRCATAACCRPRSRPPSQARRLDPKVRVSAAHTCFMLGDYDGVIEYEPEGITYMRNLALIDAGQADEALAALDQRGHVTPAPAGVLRESAGSPGSQRVGRREHRRTSGSLRPFTIPRGVSTWRAISPIWAMSRTALPLLVERVEDGFFCLPAFARDPWLDSLRGRRSSRHPSTAEARHRQAIISFLTAEGDRVLGIPQPV